MSGLLSRLRSPIRPKADDALVDELVEDLSEALFYASRGDMTADPRAANAIARFVRRLLDLKEDERHLQGPVTRQHPR